MLPPNKLVVGFAAVLPNRLLVGCVVVLPNRLLAGAAFVLVCPNPVFGACVVLYSVNTAFYSKTEEVEQHTVLPKPKAGFACVAPNALFA